MPGRTEWTIRLATRRDRAAIARVFRAALESLGFIEMVHTPGEDSSFIAGLMLGADVWVAEMASEVIGFAAVARGRMPCLYVAPGWQGRGIGSALLDTARAGRSSLTLRCLQQNAGARRFYERHGFLADGARSHGMNDEGMPDMEYRWQAPANESA